MYYIEIMFYERFLSQDSFWSELLKELKFIGKFGENEKPVRKYPPRNADPEPAQSNYSADIYSNSNNFGYARNKK